MSNLTLVSNDLCPFVQRAAIVLGEKGVAFERLTVDLGDKPDWFLALSPTGKVPLLRVRSGDQDAAIFESLVICEYLDESQPGPRLHPDDALGRAQHRGWMEFAASMLMDAWGWLNAHEEGGADARAGAFRAKLARFEDVLQRGPFFGDEVFSMVDAVVAPTFRYFDGLPDAIATPHFAGLPKVSRWRAALAARPSVRQAVKPDYAARIRQHLVQSATLVGRRLTAYGHA